MFWKKAIYVAAFSLSLVLAAGGILLCTPVANSADPPLETRQVAAVAVVQEKEDAKAKSPQPAAPQGADRKAEIRETFTGRTEPLESVQLRSRVTGYLVKVLAKDGAEVKQGDLLFEIDPRPYQVAMDKATAIVAQSESHLQHAAVEYNNTSRLLKQKVVSATEVELYAAKRAEAQAAVRAAQAGLENARLQLSFTRITAPIAGIVGGRLLGAGNLVKADETVVATITSRDPMVVTFNVDERTVLRLRRAMAAAKVKGGLKLNVAMGLSDEKDYPHRGKMEPIDFRVDPDTGAVRMRAVFPNSDHFLVPGLSCRVRLMESE